MSLTAPRSNAIGQIYNSNGSNYVLLKPMKTLDVGFKC